MNVVFNGNIVGWKYMGDWFSSSALAYAYARVTSSHRRWLITIWDWEIEEIKEIC